MICAGSRPRERQAAVCVLSVTHGQHKGKGGTFQRLFLKHTQTLTNVYTGIFANTIESFELFVILTDALNQRDSVIQIHVILNKGNGFVSKYIFLVRYDEIPLTFRQHSKNQDLSPTYC